jgi:hypothetical protein
MNKIQDFEDKFCFDELYNMSFDGEIKNSILTIKSASKIDEYALDKITSNNSGSVIREWNKQQKNYSLPDIL